MGQAFSRLMGYGTSGVDLFFVLSGFLITGILYDARGTQHYFRNFYMRRVLRIFPLYYGVLLLAFVILPLLSRGAFAASEDRQGWLWLYGANVYLSVENSWAALGWFSHFWSLAVEEHFYLVWPLVIFLLPRRQAMVACMVAAGVAIACRTAGALAGNYPVAIEAQTPCRLDGLAIGAYLALAARGPRGLPPLQKPAFVALLLAGTAFVALQVGGARILGLNLGGRLALEFGLYAVIYGSLLVLVVSAAPWTRFGALWNSRVLRFFGKYSYALYVFQNPLIPITALWFTPADMARLTGSLLLGRIAYIAVMAGLTLMLAVTSWNVFEKHFLKLKNRFEPREELRIADCGLRIVESSAKRSFPQPMAP
jgi:peptidoglycan/LPS O-acetylase OafA/YrhL